jgi:antitoxin ParD1/3/4
MGQLLGGLSHD